MKTEILFSSARQDWATPQHIFDQLDAEFHFTLDPCADERNHKCDKYFTEADNGLDRDWSGERVFCNPPYSDVKAWAKKCFDECYCGKCELAVMLVPARVDTQWFHQYIYHKSEIRFLEGRLKFGGHSVNAPFPSMIVIFRGRGK